MLSYVVFMEGSSDAPATLEFSSITRFSGCHVRYYFYDILGIIQSVTRPLGKRAKDRLGRKFPYTDTYTRPIAKRTCHCLTPMLGSRVLVLDFRMDTYDDSGTIHVFLYMAQYPHAWIFPKSPFALNHIV